MDVILPLAFKRKQFNNKTKMKHKHLNESGFIPLILTILAVVVVIIYLAYTRVLHAAH